MSPTQIFSSNGGEILKTGQVSFQNGPYSFQNAQIDTFRSQTTITSHLGGIPLLNRFNLQNLDGRVAQGTEKEVLANTGLSRQLFFQLKTGRTEYAKHWKILFYEENGVRKCIKLQGSKRKYIIFYRDSGHVIKRTRIEFARLTGLDRNFIYERIRKGQKIEGWNYDTKIIC